MFVALWAMVTMGIAPIEVLHICLCEQVLHTKKENKYNWTSMLRDLVKCDEKETRGSEEKICDNLYIYNIIQRSATAFGRTRNKSMEPISPYTLQLTNEVSDSWVI